MIKIQICFVIFKKVIFDNKNLDLFCYMFYKEWKRFFFFLRREFHS